MPLDKEFKDKVKLKRDTKIKDWVKADRDEFPDKFRGRKFDKPANDFLRGYLLEIPDGEAGDQIIEDLHTGMPPHIRIGVRVNKDGKRMIAVKTLTDPATYPNVIALESLFLREKRVDEFPPDPEL